MAEKIRVLIADDHAVIRQGLIAALGAEPNIKVVGEARDGSEAINKALQLNPDVILMDMFMPHLSGLDALMSIREQIPGIKVLVLTISERDDDVFRAIRLGAQGYLLKSATIAEIVDAVRKTAAGETMLATSVAARLVAEFRQNANAPELSDREKEILQLLGEGLTNTEIGSRLFITESTVRTYIHRLLEKLHLRNRAEAAAYAVQHHMTRKLF